MSAFGPHVANSFAGVCGGTAVHGPVSITSQDEIS